MICAFVLTMGKNKGKECGKKTKKGFNGCPAHFNKIKVVEKVVEEKVEVVEEKVVEKVVEEKVVEKVVEEKVVEKVVEEKEIQDVLDDIFGDDDVVEVVEEKVEVVEEKVEVVEEKVDLVDIFGEDSDEEEELEKTPSYVDVQEEKIKAEKNKDKPESDEKKMTFAQLKKAHDKEIANRQNEKVSAVERYIEEGETVDGFLKQQAEERATMKKEMDMKKKVQAVVHLEKLQKQADMKKDPIEYKKQKALQFELLVKKMKVLKATNEQKQKDNSAKTTSKTSTEKAKDAIIETSKFKGHKMTGVFAKKEKKQVEQTQ